ncbi:MAG: GntR family transcriptional regulator [Burkholderiales bacterium]|nr:GntR family transcriptional regulator [Burkholderiales bacterium]
MRADSLDRIHYFAYNSFVPLQARTPPPVTFAVNPPEGAALHAAVATRLRDMIVEGQLSAGSRLNERVLAAALEVSRTPLREAFKMLAGEGLVELLPNRGAVVARMGTAEVAAAFDVIGALEGLAGELACRHITADELAEIRALQFDMLASHARRDLPGYFRANMRIHALINAAARNPVLTETFARLNSRIHATRYRSNLTQERWDHAVAEHAEMLKLLEARDGAKLRALLESHLHRKRDTILALFAAQPAAT